MVADHDSSSGNAAPASVDPLSDVLQTVSLSGALFFLVDATSPWCVDVPDAKAFAAHLFQRPRHIISYHVVVEGRGRACVPGTDISVEFEQGDIIVFPHGDAYVMQSEPEVPPEFDREQMLEFFRQMASGQLPFIVPEGGGEEPPAKFLCGFLGCDASPFNPLLAQLPSLVRVQQPRVPGDLLRRLVELTLEEARAPRSGSDAVRLRLSELLFVEVVRRYIDGLPQEQNGWLRGLHDPVVGQALACLHAQPQHSWSLDELAMRAGSSRTVLAERFSTLIGQAPMTYLAHWRVQLAARRLADTDAKVGAIALDVGYGSEAAFSRAFKKVAGMSPGEFRRDARNGSGC